MGKCLHWSFWARKSGIPLLRDPVRRGSLHIIDAQGIAMKYVWAAMIFLASMAPSVAQETPSSAYEESPFLWAGQVYADPEAQISVHIRRSFTDIPFAYPSATSCLEGSGDAADLLQADLKWNDLPDAAALNVCFFRVFTALGSLERSAEWLTLRGWTVDPPRNYPNLAHQYDVPEAGFRSFAARWNVRENGAPYGPSEQREWLERAVAQISIQSFWSPAAGLVHVRVVESPGG